MTSCQSKTIYISPGQKLSLAHHRVTAVLGEQEIEITHRSQFRELRSSLGWNGFCRVQSRSDPKDVTYMRLDPLLVAGHLPENSAWWRMVQIAKGSSLAEVGGPRQLSEVVLGVSSKSLGKKVFSLLQTHPRGVAMVSAASGLLSQEDIEFLFSKIEDTPATSLYGSSDPQDLKPLAALLGLVSPENRRQVLYDLMHAFPSGATPDVVGSWAKDDFRAAWVINAAPWNLVLEVVKQRSNAGLPLLPSGIPDHRSLRARDVVGACARGDTHALAVSSYFPELLPLSADATLSYLSERLHASERLSPTLSPWPILFEANPQGCLSLFRDSFSLELLPDSDFEPGRILSSATLALNSGQISSDDLAALVDLTSRDLTSGRLSALDPGLDEDQTALFIDAYLSASYALAKTIPLSSGGKDVLSGRLSSLVSAVQEATQRGYLSRNSFDDQNLSYILTMCVQSSLYASHEVSDMVIDCLFSNPDSLFGPGKTQPDYVSREFCDSILSKASPASADAVLSHFAKEGLLHRFADMFHSTDQPGKLSLPLLSHQVARMASSPSPVDRRAAATAIEALSDSDPGLSSALSSLFLDRDDTVRHIAARTTRILARDGSPSALAVFKNAMADPDNEDSLSQLVSSLGALSASHPDFVSDCLKRTLKSDSLIVRCLSVSKALTSFAATSPSAALDLLVTSMDDRSSNVRYEAFTALGLGAMHYGPKTDTATLASMINKGLTDSSELVRNEALSAFYSIKFHNESISQMVSLPDDVSKEPLADYSALTDSLSSDVVSVLKRHPDGPKSALKEMPLEEKISAASRLGLLSSKDVDVARALCGDITSDTSYGSSEYLADSLFEAISIFPQEVSDALVGSYRLHLPSPGFENSANFYYVRNLTERLVSLTKARPDDPYLLTVTSRLIKNTPYSSSPELMHLREQLELCASNILSDPQAVQNDPASAAALYSEVCLSENSDPRRRHDNNTAINVISALALTDRDSAVSLAHRVANLRPSTSSLTSNSVARVALKLSGNHPDVAGAMIDRLSDSSCMVDPEVVIALATNGVKTRDPLLPDLARAARLVKSESDLAESVSSAVSGAEVLGVLSRFAYSPDLKDQISQTRCDAIKGHPLSLRVISSVSELERNAAEMDNCTAGYVSQLQDGGVMLYMSDSSKKHRFNAFIEFVSGSWVLNQINTPGNRPSESLRPVEKWLTSELKKLPPP